MPAIDDVDFALQRGEIHAIVGENGAGKSTLTKVMAGVVSLTSGADAGRRHAGRRSKRRPRRCNLGIAMVFQETSLVPTMTVAQNLFLGQEQFFNRLRGIYIAAQHFLQSLKFDVDPTAVVSLLGAAKKQMVEIARAVLHKAKVIIFDEPTATLTPEEKKYFFDLVCRPQDARRLGHLHLPRARGGAAALRPHHGPARRQARRHRRHGQLRPRPHRPGDGRPRPLADALRPAQDHVAAARASACCSVQNLRMAAMVKNNSLSVFAGQITGVFGLVGSGRTETFKIVAGVIKRDFFHGGEILLHDRPVRYRVPRAGREGRHRLRHRRPQDRRLLRDHVDRRQHLPRPARQAARQAHRWSRRSEASEVGCTGSSAWRSARSARM